MTNPPPVAMTPPGPLPHWPIEPANVVEVELEQARWEEIESLTGMLTEAERLMPGYFVDPDWSTKDLVGHLGMWFVEARRRLIDIAANAYVPRDADVDAANAAALAGLHDVPWDDVWRQTSAARVWMLDAWLSLTSPDDVAGGWIRKAGSAHYGEHLPRLRAWVATLMELRSRPPVDERDP